MTIPFTKASACGNDFLIIEGRHAPGSVAEFSKRICDRHNGVGADGVEWLFPAQDCDAEIRLINADGTEAEISGNGTRCVAAYLASQGAAEKLAIRTGAGMKHCELISRADNRYEFAMEMGQPQVGEPFALKTGAGEVRGTPVSMGNPHYVILVNEFAPDWPARAADVQRQPNFNASVNNAGVNVEFVRIAGPNAIDVRFYERGVGETQSSGTGSCASAVAAIAAGKVKSPVQVQAQGGTQIVRWEGNSVFLRGSAELICRGEFLG
jgi:diaminopimelate epimerase